jgi:hypothetical protein
MRTIFQPFVTPVNGMNKLLIVPTVIIILYTLACLQYAHATSDSSYKWGYSQAIVEHKCDIHEHPCYDDVGMDDVCRNGPAINDNETACDDGWNHAWDHIKNR